MSFVYLVVAVVCVTLTGWPIRAWRNAHDNGLDSLYQAAISGMIIHGGIALALAAIGVFSLALHIGIVGIGLVIIILVGRRQHVSFRVPLFVPAERWAIVAGAGVLSATLMLNSTPSQVILGGRDAGIYANTGIMIARTGSIRQYDAVIADLAQRKADDGDAAQGWSNLLGVQSGMRFMSSRMRLAGLFISETNSSTGEFTPQFLHLFPAWIALFASAFGVQYGILATGIAGFMGVWSVGMAGRAMRSPWLGVIAMALLACNGVQVWFSRYPMSETTAQWLIFVVLYGVARMAQQPVPRDIQYAGLLAGAAAGQLILARLDFVFVIAPLLAWIIWRWIAQQIDSPFRWFVGGFTVCGIHGMIHLLTISKNYFIDTFFAMFQKSALSALAIYPFLTPTLQRVFLVRPCSPLTAQPCPGESIADAPWRYGRIGGELAVLLGIVAIIWVMRRQLPALMRLYTRMTPWYRPLLRISAIASIVLITYAYGIRPQIVSLATIAAAPTCVSSAQRATPTGECLALQGYIGAPITPPVYSDGVMQRLDTLSQWVRGKPPTPPQPLRDMYANSMANLVRVGWYISPLGIMLSALGLCAWLWHGVTRRDWLFMLVTLSTAVIFIQLSYGTSTQTYIYIMRRYLPTVYPGLALFSAYAIMSIWKAQWWRRFVSITCASMLLVFLVVTIRPIIRTPEHAGAFEQVATLAATSTINDVVLIRGGAPNYVAARDASDVLALPLMAIHGRAVFGIRSQTPDNYAPDLVTLYTRWMQQGRRVYLLLGANGAMWLPGMTLVKQAPFTFMVPEFSQLTQQKPASFGKLTITYQRYELLVGNPQLPTRIDYSDTASQVAGFYTQETINGRTFAWTAGTAVLRFTAPQRASTLHLRVSAGKRPAAIGPATLCVDSMAQRIPQSDADTTWTPLGCTVLDGDTVHTIQVTIPATTSPTGTVLVQLRTSPWVAAAVDPRQNDWRPLGVQFLAATIETP